MSRAGEAAFVVAEPVAGWGRGKPRHAVLRRRQAAELVGGAEPDSSGHWRLRERCSSSEAAGPGGVVLSGTEQLIGGEHGQVVANVDAVEQRWGVRTSLGYAHRCGEAGCDVDEPVYRERVGPGTVGDAFGFEEAGAAGASASQGECRGHVCDAEEPVGTDYAGRHEQRDWPSDWTSNWSDPDHLAALSGRVDAAVSDLRFAKGPLKERAKEIDELLLQVVRGKGCLDLAIGGLLAQMLDGDHMLKVGFSTRRDYIRKVLDVPPRTALEMAQVGRELPERPLLNEAVRTGCVGWRKALLILDVAKGEEEAVWVSIAEEESHRSLRTMVKARGGVVEEEEKYVSKTLRLLPEQRAKVDEAERLCRLELGADAKRHECLKATAEEYMGAHGAPRREKQRAARSGEEKNSEKEENEEKDSRRWVRVWKEHATKVRAAGARRQASGRGGGPGERRKTSAHPNGAPPEPGRHRNPSAYSNGTTAAPEWDRNPSARPNGADHHDPHTITAQLHSLVRARKDWNNLLGPLAWAIKEHRLWRHLNPTYTSLTHYCTDRLGICERTLRQHAWLEARLQALPQLRQAYESRKLSFMKTRSIAKVATPFNVDEKITDAKDRTSLSVEHEADKEEDRNLSARGRMRLFGPEESMTTIQMAMDRAQELAREGGEGYITPGEALSRVAEHFVEVWKDLVEPPKGRRARILGRCEGICEVPECSRAAHHLHHIVYRSHGGKNEDSNMVALCPAHHLRGIHHGYMRVKGKAGARVVWEIALRDLRTKETYIAKLEDVPRKVEL